MNTRNIAIFSTTPQLLETVLQIPDGIEIIGAEWDFVSRTIRIYIEGKTLPQVEVGERATNLNPTCTRDESGKISWDFGA